MSYGFLVGISNYYGPLATTPIKEFEDHWRINTIGPVVLFQAAHKLLLASPTKAPVFAVISSAVGSIARYMPMSCAAYGSSKTAVNFLVKVLDDEHAKDGLISMAISPGWVATEMVSLALILTLRVRALKKFFLNRAIGVQSASPVCLKRPSLSTTPSKVSCPASTVPLARNLPGNSGISKLQVATLGISMLTRSLGN